MATYTAIRAKTATLTGTTVDTVTLSGLGRYNQVEVVNVSGATALYVRWGENTATAPTAGGDDCYVVLAGGSLTFPTGGGLSQVVVKVIGNGNQFNVAAFDA